MSSGNWQTERKRNYELKKHLTTASETVKTGLPAQNYIYNNPVYVEDPAADLTITVGSGEYVGQTIYIVDKSNSGSKTITISVTAHRTSSPETFTISTEGQSLLLGWSGEKWDTIGGSATAT